MSAVILPSKNSATTSVSQKFSSLRGIIRIPVKRSRNTIVNGDNNHLDDLSNNVTFAFFFPMPILRLTYLLNVHVQFAEFAQNHPYGKTSARQGAKPYMSQPMLGCGLEAGDVDDIAARHSIDYLGPPKEGGNSSASPTRNSLPPTRSSGNSLVRLSPASSDAGTRLRHVPRCLVARARPTTPVTYDKWKGQNRSGHSKSVSDALLNGVQTSFAILGFGVGVEVTGTTANSYRVLEVSPDRSHNGPEPLGHGPGHNTSPGRKEKQENPIIPLPHDHTPLQSPASVDQDKNRSPNSSQTEAQSSSLISRRNFEFELSALVNHSKVEQDNSDLDKSAAEKPVPQSLFGESSNGIGSASRPGCVDELSPSPSPPGVSNDSLIPPRKVDDTELNTNSMVSRAATTSRLTTTHIPQSRRKHLQAADSMTRNNEDQSEDDTPTPTVPFPPPKRSMTTGMLSLSRAAKPPPLSLPPLDRRLGFKGFTEGAARLSPSVIIRSPPLPLINLPVLVTPCANKAASNKENFQDKVRRSRLMSMPLLPLQGSSRGTRGHEEVDDLEEEDEENEDGNIPSSSRNERSRPSLDSEGDADDDVIVEQRSALSSSSQTLSRTSSSYETARAELSPSFSVSHRWDEGWPPGPDAANSSSSSSSLKVSPHLPQVDSLLPGARINSDSSMVPDRKSIRELDRRSYVGYNADHARLKKGKAKQEVGDDGSTAGEVIDDNSTAMKDLGMVLNSNSRKNGTSGGGSRADDGRSGSKVVATHDVKVSHAYDVLEWRFGTGSDNARSAGSNYNSPFSDLENGVSPGHPLPLRAVGSTSRESILGSPRPGDRTMRSNNDMSSTSTTPFGSPMVGSGGGSFWCHNEMYKRVSKSLIDVRAIETKEKVEKMVRDQEKEEDRKRTSRVKGNVSYRSANEGAVSRDENKWVGYSKQEYQMPENGIPWVDLFGNPTERTTGADTPTNGKTASPQERLMHPLRRRRSMPMADPPSYTALFANPPPLRRPELQIQPREDEGMEKLPPYTNEIFLKAVMPRKMEFSSPGVQAKDRKWRRVVCVLEGTVLKVYKCPARSAGVSAIGEWWENKVGVGDHLTDNGLGSNGARRVDQNSATTPGDLRESNTVLAREIEPTRAKSSEVGEVSQHVLQIESSPGDSLPRPQRQGHHQLSSTVVHGVTKSALTFAVQLLKPSTPKHSRTSSEVSNDARHSTFPSQPRRASLNIPHASTSGRTTPSIDHAHASHNRSGSVQSHSHDTVFTHLTIPGQSSLSRPSTTASGGQIRTGQSSISGDKFKEKRTEHDAKPDENDLIRAYTLQHAESGLGKDYTKRQHVVRVRLEGEQFLLQAKNVENVVAWIEVS